MDKLIKSETDIKSYDHKQLFEHYLCIIKLHLAKLDLITDPDARIELQGKISWMLDELKVLYFNK